MLVENYYPSDIRVRREAESLAENGYAVDIIALRKKAQSAYETYDGITVHRIPELSLFKKSAVTSKRPVLNFFIRYRPVLKYLVEYMYFTAYCLIKSLEILSRKNIDVLHLHNPPDTLFVIAFIFKLFGKKVVFDHHDLSPELFSVRFRKKMGFIRRLLVLFEGLSCRFADVLICTNASYKEIDIKRHGIDANRVYIVRNNPNLIADASYQPDQSKKTKTILYVGSINPQDGVDVLVSAIEKLIRKVGDNTFQCEIVGDGDSLPAVKAIVKERNLESYIKFHGYVFDRTVIFKLLREADICVEPAPDNELNRHSTFIKIMEYMSAGKPIVAFDLKESRSTGDGAAIFIKNQDVDGFADAIQNCLKTKPCGIISVKPDAEK